MEAALALPVLVLAALLSVQSAVVVRDALAVELAAREGAREAAVTASDQRVAQAVRRAAPGLADRLEVEVEPPESERRRGQPVTVRVGYDKRVTLPLLGGMWTTSLPLRAAVVMRLERPGPTPTASPP